ncbi:hypothetical protein Despr_0483 [Desulfobulbus propionicus DSM 2032]|uniref:TubC N-terminal docking domain-containing protein n=1 Tax=Desulfobulbus propionicus (strain ATCC 33891 / DSM 2032 / VKM B-1956 / 1pr3) TaxID=577650 RepID=A0A7U3YJR7_DESPD|nr:hypothetical protein [Desulfobulbus propionicus]ADW16663.1 hypothetical protein Despr_0483 [Desulfobulbus propionicus DSM 2032]
MNARAIIEAAVTDGLVVNLSPTGSLKAIGEQEAVNRWRPLLKQHKTEIINLLSGKPSGEMQATRPTLPNWCNARCDHYHRLDVPDVGTMQWCCWETDERHWRRDRIDTMSRCPEKEK